jgi:hypothetical protein
MNSVLQQRCSCIYLCNYEQRRDGIRWSGGIPPLIFTSTVGGAEWSASRPGRITSGKVYPAPIWIKDWVGPRASLDATKKRNFAPTWNWIPTVQPVTRLHTDWGTPPLDATNDLFEMKTLSNPNAWLYDETKQDRILNTTREYLVIMAGFFLWELKSDIYSWQWFQCKASYEYVQVMEDERKWEVN